MVTVTLTADRKQIYATDAGGSFSSAVYGDMADALTVLSNAVNTARGRRQSLEITPAMLPFLQEVVDKAIADKV